MIEVLLVCEYPSLNGGERSMLALVDAMQRGGVNFTFAAPSAGPLAAQLRRRRIDHIPWNVFDDNQTRKSLDRIRQQLHQIITREKPTLVHANSLSTTRISGPVAAESKVPCIGHLRDILKLNRTAIEDINCHDRLIAVSRATRDWHVRQGLTAAKTFVVYNGIDTELFKPRGSTGYLRAELGISQDAVIALSIGQVGLRKGIDVTLSALRTVADELTNLHLVIVGERNSTKEETVEYERQLHARAEQVPLHGRVHFLGRRSDVAGLLGEAALLIHAARQEPLGRVLLEAASAGVPTIATRVGGTEEIFPENPPSALLTPADNPWALARAIRRILRSDALRDRLASAARQRAVQCFDVDVAAKTLLEHYRLVANF